MFDLLACVVDFFHQDPFRALGLVGLACIAISMTTDFDLLAALGFVEIEDRSDRKASAA